MYMVTKHLQYCFLVLPVLMTGTFWLTPTKKRYLVPKFRFAKSCLDKKTQKKSVHGNKVKSTRVPFWHDGGKQRFYIPSKMKIVPAMCLRMTKKTVSTVSTLLFGIARTASDVKLSVLC